MPCAFTVEEVRSSQRRTLVSLGRYRRLSDSISSALVFLRENVLLRAVLSPEDLRETFVEEPLRAHGVPSPWHGVPAMSVLYAHLNRLHRDHPFEEMLFLTAAPGAAPAHLANLWIEGGTSLQYGAAGGGLAALVRRLDEATRVFEPCIRNHPTAEDGLSQALLALDRMKGTVVCALDAELSDQRFLDRAVGLMRTSGAVLLPILLLQGRVGARPGYASLDDSERTASLQEMGYAVRTVEIGLQFEALTYTALEWAWHSGHGESVGEQSGHPLIVLKVPRSLAMPPLVSTALDRDAARFLASLREDEALMESFRTWLEGYLPGELVEADGAPDRDILDLCAPPENRVARSRCRLGDPV